MYSTASANIGDVCIATFHASGSSWGGTEWFVLCAFFCLFGCERFRKIYVDESWELAALTCGIALDEFLESSSLTLCRGYSGKSDVKYDSYTFAPPPPSPAWSGDGRFGYPNCTARSFPMCAWAVNIPINSTPGTGT